MRYLTIVYRIPAELDAAALTEHKLAAGVAWGHAIHECQDLRRAVRALLNTCDDAPRRSAREGRSRSAHPTDPRH